MRSWIIIPAMGVAALGIRAGLAVAAGAHIEVPALVATGLAGAALAAMIRALVGDSAASRVATVLAPIIFTLLAPQGSLAPTLGMAGFAWTVAELCRPTTLPLVALLPAAVAAVCAPACIALLPLAASRLVTAPWQRPRWAIAAPIVATFVALVGIGAGAGVFPGLGTAWFGPTGAHDGLLARYAQTLGPILALGALAGALVCLLGVMRTPLAAIAIASCATGAILCDLRAGTVGATSLGLAAIGSALAIGRLAGTVHFGVGQACVGAAAGTIVVVPQLLVVLG